MKKDQFLSKYEINLNKLNEVTNLSPTKKYFTWIQSTLAGTFGGMGFGSTVMFVLAWSAIAIAGITVATVFTTLATVSGGVLLGGFSLLYARHQTQKAEAKLQEDKKAFDQNQQILQKSLMDLTETFQSLNKLLNQKYLTLRKRGIVEENEAEFAEVVNGDKNAKSLRKTYSEVSESELNELQQIIDVRRTLLRRLAANLSLVSGGNYKEKLAELFNTTESQLVDVMMKKAETEGRRSKIEDGLKDLVVELQRLPQPNQGFISEKGMLFDKDGIQQNINELQQTLTLRYHKSKEAKDPKLIRRLTTSYGVAALGGFFTGIGGYVAIASLAVGGTAALLSGGIALPILLGGLGVAAVSVGLAVLYRWHVEKKKQTATKTLQRMSETATVLNSDLETTNSNSKALLNNYEQKGKHEAHQLELEKAHSQGLLKGLVNGRFQIINDEVKDLEKIDKQFNDLQNSIDGSKIRTTHRGFDRAKQIEINLGYLESLHKLEQEYTAIKLNYDAKLKEKDFVTIDVNYLASLDGYQKVTNHLKFIELTIAELQQKNHHYEQHLLEKGEHKPLSEQRAKTLVKVNPEAEDDEGDAKAPSHAEKPH